jgi:outer membrane protein OmpA-like peptidoglycan-associated protein
VTGRRVATGLAAAVVAACSVTGASGVASATSAADGGEVLDVEPPVLEVVAPVLDIEFSSADVEGVARVEEQPDEIRVTLDSTVLFGRDSATLRNAAGRRLREVADSLRDAGAGPVRIAGYTDDLGSAAHGLDLSRRRARAVADVLRPQLPGNDFPFTVEGLGEADPAVPNDSEKNRRLNRRVEITFRPR